MHPPKEKRRSDDSSLAADDCRESVHDDSEPRNKRVRFADEDGGDLENVREVSRWITGDQEKEDITDDGGNDDRMDHENDGESDSDQESNDDEEEAPASSKMPIKRRNPFKRGEDGELVTSTLTETQVNDLSIWIYTVWWIASIHATFETGEISEGAYKRISDWLKEYEEFNDHGYEMSLDEPLPRGETYRNLEPEMESLLMPEISEQPEDHPEVAAKFVPDINYTGPAFMDAMTVTGQEVLEAASKTVISHKNHVFGEVDKEKTMHLFDGTNDLKDEEKEHFIRVGHEGVKDMPEMFQPVPLYHVPDSSQETCSKIKDLCLNESFFVLRNVDNAFGINRKIFDINRVASVRPNMTHPVHRQLAQRPTTNYRYHTKGRKKQNGFEWRVQEVRETADIRTFVDHVMKQRDLATIAYGKIVDNPESIEYIVEDLQRELLLAQMPVYNTKGQEIPRPDYLLLAFGTNIELTDEEFGFEEESEFVTNFPNFLAPNGEENLLNFADEVIDGLNKAQLFIKPPGARTAMHTENGALASINYNIGPGNCVWYAVHLEDFAKMTKLIIQKSRIPNTKKNNLYNVLTWPNEEECLNAGIRLMKCVQKPGDMVYVGIGTYHWVQSNGATSNIAWNVAQPTCVQLAMMAIMNDHYQINHSVSLIPIETIIWNMVIEKEELGEDMRTLMKHILMRSLAKAQMDLDVAKKMKLELVPAENHPNVRSVERCSECNVVLFNYLPHDKNDITFCLKCCSKLSDRRKLEIIVYERYDIDHLANLFDEFIVTASAPSSGNSSPGPTSDSSSGSSTGSSSGSSCGSFSGRPFGASSGNPADSSSGSESGSSSGGSTGSSSGASSGTPYGPPSENSPGPSPGPSSGSYIVFP